MGGIESRQCDGTHHQFLYGISLRGWLVKQKTGFVIGAMDGGSIASNQDNPLNATQ